MSMLPKQVVKITHDADAPFNSGWRLSLDDKPVENLRGFTLEVDVDAVPLLTLRLLALDIEVAETITAQVVPPPDAASAL